MMVNGKIDKLMDLEFMPLTMEMNSKDSGKIILFMVKVKKLLKRAISMKDSSNMERNMEQEKFYGIMEVYIMGNGQQMSHQGLESITGVMVGGTGVNGQIPK